MWHTPNEVPQDTFLMDAIKKYAPHILTKKFLEQLSKRLVMFLSRRRAVGVVKGITDLTLYHNNKLHAFDIKLGADKLSKEQISFAEQVIKQGGTFDVISDFESFKSFILAYVGKPEL